MRTRPPRATRRVPDLPGEADRSSEEAVQRVHRLARVHVKIVAGRHLLRPGRLRVPEMDSDLRLVRALVRREPDVPIDAGERPAERLGIGDEIRADLLEPRPGVANEPQARFLHRVLVTFLVLREPFFAVVLRQVTEEPEEVRGEVFRFLGHLWPRFADIAAHRLNIGANGRASKTARTEPILSPRIRYHSQMNAVPAGVFVTMSYNRQTSSPSTNVFRGSTLTTMWWSFPKASKYGSGRLNDSNGPTNDRSSCMYRRAPAKSPPSQVLSDTPSQSLSHSPFTHAPSAARGRPARPRGSGRRARGTRRNSPCPGRPRAGGRSRHPPARLSFAPRRGRRRARSSCSPGAPSPASVGFPLDRRLACGTRGTRPSGT